MATLCKIAASLETPVNSFFQELCPNEVILTRNNHLARQPLNDAVRILNGAGMITSEQPNVTEPARELVLCLSGQIEYEADGKCYQLSPGDTLSFNGQAPHCWRSRSTGPAVAVMVLCHTSNANFTRE